MHHVEEVCHAAFRVMVARGPSLCGDLDELRAEGAALAEGGISRTLLDRARAVTRREQLIASGASGHQKETFVRLGKRGSRSIGGPSAARSSAASSPSPSTRIAHCGLPIETCWNSRPAIVPVPSAAPPG